MKNKGALYLIPAPIATPDQQADIPAAAITAELFTRLRHYIVEDIRTARRFMRKAGYSGDFSEITFFDLGKHADKGIFHTYLQPCLESEDVGLLSEAGMPCIADPGSVLVSMAHAFGIRVIPLPGPSSLLMALASSGMNGQRFEFHGYLPIDDKARKHALLGINRDILSTGKSHIFIETPFRNDRMLAAILAHCSPDVGLCVAVAITEGGERIRTKSVSEWKGSRITIGKVPAVFILGRPE